MNHLAITCARLAALGVMSIACATDGPRPTLPFPTPQAIEPRPQIAATRKFSLAILDFDATSDATSEKLGASGLRVTLPAMLATELQRDGRFQVHEAGNLRRPLGSELLDEASSSQNIDGYVNGTIVTARASETGETEQVCFEVRLSNAYSHAMMFARSICSAVRVPNATLGVERAGVKQVALEMSQALTRAPSGRVVHVSGRHVYIDRGRAEGIKNGMVALIIPTARTARDEHSLKLVSDYTGIASSEIPPIEERGAIAQITVLALSEEPHRSIALLVRGGRVAVGDTVLFK